MKTLLFALFLGLVLASNMLGMCAGCSNIYIPPTVAPPSIGTGAAVTGGAPVEGVVQATPTPLGSGFLLSGPMDVEASADTLTLQFTLTATFQPQTSTQYWVYSILSDFIWSNTLGTTAQLDSVTSDASILSGTCPPDTGCGTLAQGSTSLVGSTPIPIPYDPASTYSYDVSAYLLSSYWGTSSIALSNTQSYTLVTRPHSTSVAWRLARSSASICRKAASFLAAPLSPLPGGSPCWASG